jgi:hypothetical protein
MPFSPRCVARPPRLCATSTARGWLPALRQWAANASVAFHLRTRGSDLLFTGDIEKDAEAPLINSWTCGVHKHDRAPNPGFHDR